MDLTKILKVGDRIYTPLFGNISIEFIEPNKKYSIKAYAEGFGYVNFTSKGQVYEDGPECLIFPSKENRDWNKFKMRKETSFKPFDKVLVRSTDSSFWNIDFYSYHHIKLGLFVTFGGGWNQCIPYNSETEHLIGTAEKCPNKYIIW